MKIKIAEDFSKAPGPRYRTEGKYSGQQFREDILHPRVLDALEQGVVLTVDFDGAFGYGTSFLEEAFGGLIRENQICRAKLSSLFQFVSYEQPELIVEINAFMDQAERERDDHEG